MMEISPIDGNFAAVSPIIEPKLADPSAVSTFDTVMDELGRVNDKLVQASGELQKVATGDAENLHGAMIAMEEARLEFQLLLQVRNRFMEAYQDLMRMQV